LNALRLYLDRKAGVLRACKPLASGLPGIIMGVLGILLLLEKSDTVCLYKSSEQAACRWRFCTSIARRSVLIIIKTITSGPKKGIYR
jgi:hypothetical protein